MTKIEWTDATWNPVRGCTKISPGCANCYAEAFAERFRGVPGHPYEQGFDLRLVPEKLDEPLRWKPPRMVFVNSMSDLFHEDVTDYDIASVFARMAMAEEHTFQVLTKRAERLPRLLGSKEFREEVSRRMHVVDPPANGMSYPRHVTEWPMPNVWIGVSCENRKHGLPRLEHLRAAPAAVRFLSIEPLLEDLGDFSLDGIAWVIVGGESGHKARPCELEWIRSVRDQCKESGTALFVKQFGTRFAIQQKDWCTARRKDRKGAVLDEWPEDLRVRESPSL